MHMKTTFMIKQALCALVVIVIATSCERFLDEKSDKKLVVPNTLEDLQALLDNVSYTNSSYVYDAAISADDYYLPDDIYASLPEDVQRMYRWEPDRLYLSTINSWQNMFKRIYLSNNVLNALKSIERTAANQATYDSIEGQALVLRGARFLDGAGTWCMAYDEETATTDLGLPLRLNPDFNAPSKRASVADTYAQILNDLHTSVPLLPLTSANAYRPTRPMAYALLARTYLYMRRYEQAGLYADSCLQLSSQLMDFNQLDETLRYPIPELNEEVIFQGIAAHIALSNSYARIAQSIYDLYEMGDLRRDLFFSYQDQDETFLYRGSFSGRSSLITGPTTSEVWLIYAEAMARNGHGQEARNALNYLLSLRYKTSFFIPVEEENQIKLLDIILLERRKELLMRGTRWMDIKRLNKEGRQIEISREIDGINYTLPPNDLRFALPIPDDIIILSGMQQNPR